MKQFALIFIIAFAVSGCALLREPPASQSQAKPVAAAKVKKAGVVPVSITPQPATTAPKDKPKKKKRWWAPWRK